MVRDIYVADTDEKAWAKPPQNYPLRRLATDNLWRGDSIPADDLP